MVRHHQGLSAVLTSDEDDMTATTAETERARASDSRFQRNCRRWGEGGRRGSRARWFHDVGMGDLRTWAAEK